jgi:hypothetical protein
MINNKKIKNKKIFSYSKLSLILAIILIIPGIFGLFFLQIIPLTLAIIALIKSNDNNKKIPITTIIIILVFSPPVMFVVFGSLSSIFGPRIDSNTADAVLTKNFSMCENLNSNSQIPCYGMIAELNKNINDCNKISENKWKEKCQDRIEGKNMVKTCNATIMKNNEVCDKINDPNCIESWNIIKENPQICESLSNRNQDDCYSTVALGICNQKYCGYIENKNAKLKCYLKSAIRNIGGVNICTQISDLELKKDCINEYGRNIYVTLNDF